MLKKRAADAVANGNYLDFVDSLNGKNNWAAKRARRLADRFQSAKTYGDYVRSIQNASPEELRNFTPEQFGQYVAYGSNDFVNNSLVPGGMALASVATLPVSVASAGVLATLGGIAGGAAGGSLLGRLGKAIDKYYNDYTNYGKILGTVGSVAGGVGGGFAGGAAANLRSLNAVTNTIKNTARNIKDIKYRNTNPGEIAIPGVEIPLSNSTVYRTPSGAGVYDLNTMQYKYNVFTGDPAYNLEGSFRTGSIINGRKFGTATIDPNEFIVQHPGSGGFVYKNTKFSPYRNHHGADVVMSKNTRAQLESGRPIANKVTAVGNYQGADNAVSPFGRQLRMATREAKQSGKSVLRELRRINRAERQFQRAKVRGSYDAYNNPDGMGYGPGAYFAHVKHAMKDNNYALRYGRQADKFLKINRGDPRYNRLLDLQDRAIAVNAKLQDKQMFVDELNSMLQDISKQYNTGNWWQRFWNSPNKAWISSNGDTNIPHPVQLRTGL